MLIGNPMIYRKLPFEMALERTLDAGFDAIELWPPQIAEFRTPALRQLLARQLRDRGVPLVRLNCADREYFQLLDADEDIPRALDGLRADIDAACDLGMKQVLTWEGRRSPHLSPAEIDGRVLDQTTQLFQSACRYAQQKGVELTIEVHPFTLGIQLDWLVALCDRLSGSSFSVTYDCCHFAVGLPDGYIQAIDRLGARIGHVHFSDSDKVSSELHFAPGAGALDLEGVVAALKRIAFQGTMMLDLWLYPLPDEGARSGVPYVRNVCRELGIDKRPA